MSRPRSTATRIRKLFDAASAPAFLLDEDHRVVYVNAACAAWLGCDAAELVGRTCCYCPPDATDPPSQANLLAPPPDLAKGDVAFVRVRVPCGRAVETGEPCPAACRVMFLSLASTAGAAILGVASADNASVSDAPPADGISPHDLHEQVLQLRGRLREFYRVDHLIGQSAAIHQARRQAMVAARSGCHTVIVGPAGSGRTFLAKAIYYASGAQSGPLIPLECAVLSEHLLDSSLRGIGRLRGSDAASGSPTLLLRGAERLDAACQSLLASWLASEKHKARVISTASEPLTSAAGRGTYRADLAALLTTLEVRLPGLAERADDLPLLAQSLVERENARGIKQCIGFAPGTLELMAQYDWPGNMDELASVVSEAHAHARTPIIAPDDLPERLRLALAARARPQRSTETIELESFLAQIERELIERAVRRAKGNKAKAARMLGLTRPRLYRRMQQLGLET